MEIEIKLANSVNPNKQLVTVSKPTVISVFQLHTYNYNLLLRTFVIRFLCQYNDIYCENQE